MFITVELLQEKLACEPGILWFKRHFPDGAEMIDVIAERTVTPDFLHWGRANLDYSQDELSAYIKKLNIVNSNYVYESNDIEHSVFVSLSSRVDGSRNVCRSHDVIDSKNIIGADSIERSHNISNSMFCYDSDRVVCSKNVNNSTDIVMSDYVINSHYIVNATSVINSQYIGSWIGTTSKITDSMFINNCYNLKNCLFCSEAQNDENLLFNQKIDPAQIEMIKKQLTSILKEWKPKLYQEDWEEEIVPFNAPKLERNLGVMFSELPDRFWDWIKTLPGYDPNILFAIVYQTKHMF